MWKRSWSLALLLTVTISGFWLSSSMANQRHYGDASLRWTCLDSRSCKYHYYGHTRSVRGIPAFAAGGFGSSSSSQQTTGTTHKKKGTGKKRKRIGLLDESDVMIAPKSRQSSTPSTSSSSSSSSPQLLDKWGLPIAKDDDIFPPMPLGTELIAVDKDRIYTLKEIQQSIRPHLEMPGLERYFDEQAIERQRRQLHRRVMEGSKLMKVRLVHQSPPIVVIDNFLTKEECEQIQSSVALPRNDKRPTNSHAHSSSSSSANSTAAYQVNSATFALAQSRRTSTSWFTHYLQVPTLLAKMHHLLGIPLEQMEEPQVVRYQAGQEFSWHYDEVPPPQLDNGGQRLATFLVYLQDVAPGGGGGTVFRDLRDDYYQHNTSNNEGSRQTANDDPQPLTVQPKQGMACIFFPAFRDGRPDDRTLHKGEVLAKNHDKWISQIWIHERTYQPVLPPGNSHQAAWPAIEEASRQLGFIE